LPTFAREFAENRIQNRAKKKYFEENMSSVVDTPALAWPTASRIAIGHRAPKWLSITMLLLLGGLAAAASILIETKLKLPGNAILKPVLPMLLGLALVPRLGAGTTMGAGAILGVTLLRQLGYQKGLGGMASLVLLGPALDFALLHAKSNWFLYARLALAGLAANGLAFAVQLTAKSYGISLGGGKDIQSWFSLAAVTYPLFGLVAGLVSGLILFHWRSIRTDAEKTAKRL
jgi:hypothetical protein